MKDSARIATAVQALFEMVEESPEDDRIELTSTPIQIERDVRPHGFGTWGVTLHGHIGGDDVEVCLVVDSEATAPRKFRVTGFRRDWDLSAGNEHGYSNWIGCDDIERRFDALASVKS